MHVRKATGRDVPRMMEIYGRARSFMAEHGNPNQWGPTGWPPEDVIREDVEAGKSHVCVGDDGRVVGTFFFDQGHDVEPDYRVIVDGAWAGVDTYGVVHRIASDGSTPGVGTFCLEWALARSGGHLRVDTHRDNVVMQGLLEKLGFVRRGTIFIEGIDDNRRIAYERLP